MSGENKTVGEEMVEKFTKIVEAVQQLMERGITKRLLILYIQDQTKLPKRDIEKVLKAVEDFINEFKVETRKEDEGDD